MKIPMMPKGVEHRDLFERFLIAGLVKIPMMPKGVEHSSGAADVQLVYGVKIPMMPKGVEHVKKLALLVVGILSEDSNDAERR